MPSKEVGISLRDLRVLDLTRNLAGPYCTMILGDMGASVVKVERPGSGDDTRKWSPPTWGGESTTFLSANRNKRSIAVNLSDPEGIKIIQKLAFKVDILVESFRPGSLEKRGLGYEELKAKNPGLIYCSISAYGNTGPLRNEPGYDPILQASTGIIDMTGEPDQAPVRLPIAVNDLGAGLWAVIGVQSALIARSESGLGCRVETSLFETASWWMNYHITSYLATGETPIRAGTGTPWLAPYEVFQASDEGLMVCAGNDNLFHKFVDVLKLPALATDERFVSNPLRVKNRGALHEIIVERFQAHTAKEWESLLKAQSIPCSRIQTVADLAQEEQLDALGIMTEYPHPLIPNLRLVNSPISLNGTRSVEHKPPPLLGEHTDIILAELGYSKSEIMKLRKRKIVE